MVMVPDTHTHTKDRDPHTRETNLQADFHPRGGQLNGRSLKDLLPRTVDRDHTTLSRTATPTLSTHLAHSSTQKILTTPERDRPF